MEFIINHTDQFSRAIYQISEDIKFIMFKYKMSDLEALYHYRRKLNYEEVKWTLKLIHKKFPSKHKIKKYLQDIVE